MQVTDPRQLYGTEVVGGDGSKLGKIEEVYLDQSTGRPEWAEVKTGLFGNKRSLLPLSAASGSNGELRVPFGKDEVKGAPHHDPGAVLSPEDEVRLFEHYNIPYGGETVTAQPGAGGGARGAVGRDVSGPETDEAMTRSEEELRVGKTTEERGRARLRKYVVTENVQTTVPVTREEVRVEREPITEANVGAATSGPAISEEEHEVVLHEEQPVVEKRAVPKERVRLSKDVVAGEAPVEGEVRKERIETEGAPE
jgi:uncharacterized protein (TIGR02271 family)